MKIVIATPLYPPEIGGPATYTKLLETELPKRGIEVVVVKFSEVRHLPKIIRHFKYAYLVFKQARGADLIYVQDPVSVGLPSLVASKLARRKLMVKIVGDYAWEQGSIRKEVIDPLDQFVEHKFKYGFLVFGFKLIQTLVVRLSDKIIVPSFYLKNIVTKWSVADKKIKVIYNSFSASKFKFESKPKLKQELNIKGITLITVGRLVPWKGFESLILVVKKIKEVIPDVNLLIVGSGPDSKKLESLIKFNDLQQEVTLLGQLKQKELFKYIYASDIFVLNTKYEGLSHQLLEVMSLGIPIVTTDVGGNPELIETGQSGILIESGNLEQLFSALLWLIKSPQEGNKMTKQALVSLSKFKTNVMLDKLIKELKSL